MNSVVRMNPWHSLTGINRSDRRPGYVQVLESIASHIRNLAIPAGTRLPSEPELIKHFGVSRTTIRKAIEDLEAQGLVRKIHGKGTFVQEPEQHGVVDSFKGVEPALAEMGIAVANDVVYQRDEEPPDWASEVFPRGPVHVICRLKTIKGKKVALEYRVVDSKAADFISPEDLKSRMLTEVLDANPATCTKRACYTVSSRTISRLEANLLQVPLSAIILVRRAVYFNQDDEAMSVGLVVFLADNVKISFDFVRQDPNMKTTLIV